MPQVIFPRGNMPRIWRHDDFIRRRGEDVQWLQALKCPCSQDSNRADPTCVVCNGDGRTHRDPQTIRGLITGVEQERRLLQAGMAILGDLLFGNLTTGPQLNDWDILKPTWPAGQPFDGELIERGAGATDKLLYEIKAVELVATKSGNDLVYWTEGTDFTVSDKTITWLTGPPAGTVYSIKYRALFEYMVFSPPMTRHERAINLGQRVLMRKRHLVTREVG